MSILNSVGTRGDTCTSSKICQLNVSTCVYFSSFSMLNFFSSFCCKSKVNCVVDQKLLTSTKYFEGSYNKLCGIR